MRIYVDFFPSEVAFLLFFVHFNSFFIAYLRGNVIFLFHQQVASHALCMGGANIQAFGGQGAKKDIFNRNSTADIPSYSMMEAPSSKTQPIQILPPPPGLRR